MAANADPPERGDATNPCTDRQSAGESCGATAPAAGPTDVTDRASGLTPETLYLVRIAMLEARVATLESELEARESDLQHVVDRYERVLQGRDACRDEPLAASEFDRTERDGAEQTRTDGGGRTGPTGTLGRLRELLQ